MAWTGAFLDPSRLNGQDPKFSKLIGDVWGKTLASAPGSSWSPSKWAPHIATIMIGHNDFRAYV